MVAFNSLRSFIVETARGPQEIVQCWDDHDEWYALLGDVRISQRFDGFLVSHRHDGLGAFHILHGFEVPKQGHRKLHPAFIPALLHAAALVRAYEAAR